MQKLNVQALSENQPNGYMRRKPTKQWVDPHHEFTSFFLCLPDWLLLFPSYSYVSLFLVFSKFSHLSLVQTFGPNFGWPVAPSICSMFFVFHFFATFLFPGHLQKLSKICKQDEKSLEIIACLFANWKHENCKIFEQSRRNRSSEKPAIYFFCFQLVVSPKFLRKLRNFPWFPKNKRNGFLCGSYFSLFLETCPGFCSFNWGEKKQENRTNSRKMEGIQNDFQN